MKKSRIIAEHGRDSVYGVILHGYVRLRNGGFPSMAFNGTKDPRMALSRAYRMLKASTDASPLPKEVDEKIAAFIRPEKRPKPVRLDIRTERRVRLRAAFGSDHASARMKKIGQALAGAPASTSAIETPFDTVGGTETMQDVILVRYQKHVEEAEEWGRKNLSPGFRVQVEDAPRRFFEEMGKPSHLHVFSPAHAKSSKAASGKETQTGLPKRPTALDHALEHDAHVAGVA